MLTNYVLGSRIRHLRFARLASPELDFLKGIEIESVPNRKIGIFSTEWAFFDFDIFHPGSAGPLP